jgi:hypothetical protein
MFGCCPSLGGWNIKKFISGESLTYLYNDVVLKAIKKVTGGSP